MKAETMRIIKSKSFWLSVLILFCVFQGFAIPYWLTSLQEPLEYRQSAMSMILGGIFFGGVILLLPFCASLPYAVPYVNEIRSSMFRWTLLRSQMRKYVLTHLGVAFLTAATGTLICFAVHTLLWNAIAPRYCPQMYPAQEIGFWEDSFLYSWSQISYGLPVYMEIGCGLAFSAGAWAVTAMAVAIWIPDQLLVMSIPACIYKIWGSAFSYYLLGIWLPSPDTLFNDAQTITSVGQAIAAYLVLITISGMAFYFGVRRRGCRA